MWKDVHLVTPTAYLSHDSLLWSLWGTARPLPHFAQPFSCMNGAGLHLHLRVRVGVCEYMCVFSAWGVCMLEIELKCVTVAWHDTFKRYPTGQHTHMHTRVCRLHWITVCQRCHDYSSMRENTHRASQKILKLHCHRSYPWRRPWFSTNLIPISCLKQWRGHCTPSVPTLTHKELLLPNI